MMYSRLQKNLMLALIGEMQMASEMASSREPKNGMQGVA